MKILIGADPEVFVRNPNHGFVCAHGMIPGTKAEPYKVPFGAVQVDGTALEFNIDPAATREEFLRNVNSVYKTLGEMVPAYRIDCSPVAEFDVEAFKAFPDESKLLGCDPDFNAWTGEANNPPQGDRPMRTAAGHIHIGWTQYVNPWAPNHYADAREVCKQLDYFIGIQTLRWDKDNRRRSMYGKAGAFRPKSYGCEYRVPSNAWLLTPQRMEFIYDETKRAVEQLAAGNNLSAKYGDLAQRIIDNNIVDWGARHPIDGIKPFEEKAA